MKKFIFSVHEKHEAKRRWSGCYCAGMKIISEAKLPINKNLQWPIEQRGMSDCWVFFKCLMALKNLQQVSELCLYDTLNLSSCLTLNFLHPERKLFTMLNYLKNFGNAAKEGLKRKIHWAAYYFTNPNSWYPVLELTVMLSAIPAI